MSQSYIPRTDAQYDEWLANFADYCQAHATELGLTPDDVNIIQDANNSWHGNYVAHQQAQAQARAKCETKDNARQETEQIVRQYVRMIQARPQTTDEQREMLRLTVADEEPTLLSEMAVESATPPLLLLDWSQRGRCIVHFGPNPGNERQNALPRGIKGAKIWFHVGGIPESEAEWQWLADDTNSPYVHAIASAQPVTIAYRAQYFDRRMRTGPFSDPVIATISV